MLIQPSILQLVSCLQNWKFNILTRKLQNIEKKTNQNIGKKTNQKFTI